VEDDMPLIERFEDIQGWQEARKLVKMVYALTAKDAFAKDFGMRDQIRRASVSVMANIAEGFDCALTLSLPDF
jgi:four helix bundle protein